MATGNQIQELQQTLTPIVKAPLSDILAISQSQQFSFLGRICGFFEAQFFRCMEAYGAKLGRLYCDLEHRDLKECVTNDKKKKRAAAIEAQRKKLYREGKLEKPFLEDHPLPGQHRPDHFEWNRIL
uniref:NADH dehydrogenase [ubiquinone] iron-sulfur protein 5 n=1 Tax=Angiostrongylus cantonensis TaxID=6313 RepID=A0A0K0DJA8_ANGCA